MNIGIIGYGNMGKAFEKGLRGHFPVAIFDHTQDTDCSSLEELLEKSTLIILAIKPKNYQTLSVRGFDKKRHLVVSIMAGVDLASLRKVFGKVPVVSAMPNIGISIGQGMTAIVDDPELSPTHRESVTSLLAPLGTFHWLPESKLAAFTALVGSGPAFCLTMMESMVDAGVSMGFSADEAKNLVGELLCKSVALAKANDWEMSRLRWQISSPKGITIAGLRKMEQCSVRSGIIETFMTTWGQAI